MYMHVHLPISSPTHWVSLPHFPSQKEILFYSKSPPGPQITKFPPGPPDIEEGVFICAVEKGVNYFGDSFDPYTMKVNGVRCGNHKSLFFIPNRATEEFDRITRKPDGNVPNMVTFQQANHCSGTVKRVLVTCSVDSDYIKSQLILYCLSPNWKETLTQWKASRSHNKNPTLSIDKVFRYPAETTNDNHHSVDGTFMDGKSSFIEDCNQLFAPVSGGASLTELFVKEELPGTSWEYVKTASTPLESEYSFPHEPMFASEPSTRKRERGTVRRTLSNSEKLMRMARKGEFVHGHNFGSDYRMALYTKSSMKRFSQSVFHKENRHGADVHLQTVKCGSFFLSSLSHSMKYRRNKRVTEHTAFFIHRHKSSFDFLWFFNEIWEACGRIRNTRQMSIPSVVVRTPQAVNAAGEARLFKGTHIVERNFGDKKSQKNGKYSYSKRNSGRTTFEILNILEKFPKNMTVLDIVNRLHTETKGEDKLAEELMKTPPRIQTVLSPSDYKKLEKQIGLFEIERIDAEVLHFKPEIVFTNKKSACIEEEENTFAINFSVLKCCGEEVALCRHFYSLLCNMNGELRSELVERFIALTNSKKTDEELSIMKTEDLMTVKTEGRF